MKKILLNIIGTFFLSCLIVKIPVFASSTNEGDLKNVTEENITTTDTTAYTISQQGFTWVYQEDSIDVGVAYDTDDPNPQFKWQSYNLNTEQWETIADWNSSNWANWKTNKGDYWLHCEMRTSDGNSTDEHTICFAYVAGNTQISGTYLGGTEDGDGTLLFGCSSTSTANNLSYSFKLYNVTDETWTSISEHGGQWVTYAPQNGTYWIHYELYTSDGRLADTRTYAFAAQRPVRRALAIGTPSSLIWAGNNLDSIGNMYANTSFLGESSITPYVYRDQDIDQITNLFEETFKDTTDNDVSYIYITCHSDNNDRIYLANNDQYITTETLKQLCDSWIKGSIVIMLDTCYSGQAISASGNENVETFAENLIDIFDSSAVPASGELASNRYYVLCSSASWEESWGWTAGNGFATKYWEYGAGWNPTTNAINTLEADANADNRVTLNEMYSYSSVKVYEEAQSMSTPMPQTVKVYPENSNFIIFGRY